MKDLYTYETNSLDDFITKIALDLNEINNAVYTKKDNFILGETEQKLLEETYVALSHTQRQIMKYKRGEL